VELFTISQVAFYLNRRPVTIRKWEEKGFIPKATFAKPGVNKDPRGRRRLYSRDQVVALVTIADAEGILHNPHAQITKTQFKAKVWAEFKRLAAQR
jgi:DNA-binding transcriptional MerR regulator